jgi:hypothetical protein
MQHTSFSADALSALLLVIIITVAILWFTRRRRDDLEFGGSTIVRCQSGHLFTTLWIPGISLKAIRLGPMRFQYCPVGGHWAFIFPVSESSLSEEERQVAYQNDDRQVP